MSSGAFPMHPRPEPKPPRVSLRGTARWPFRFALFVIFGLCSFILLNMAYKNYEQGSGMVFPKGNAPAYIVSRDANPGAFDQLEMGLVIGGVTSGVAGLCVLIRRAR